jgi:hypothetical protein
VKESKFQARLIRELRVMFDGCVILKNDANYLQGIPDLTIFYQNRWAILECKDSEDEPFEPNQEYYIDMLNSMSFAAVIYPENKEHVLRELQRAFGLGRASRVSQRL